MMPFFNRDWAGACSGCWVGAGLILGWSSGSGRDTPLQKQRRRGVGEGFARGRSDGLQAVLRRAWGRTAAAADQ